MIPKIIFFFTGKDTHCNQYFSHVVSKVADVLHLITSMVGKRIIGFIFYSLWPAMLGHIPLLVDISGSCEHLLQAIV